MWGMVARSVFGIVGDWLEGKRRVQEARVNAQVELEARRATAEIDWDIIQAENSKTSMKDEWWTWVLSAPLIAIFIPSLQPYVIQGFEALQLVPEWYIAGVALAIAAAFGYRDFVRPFMNRISGAGRRT